MLAILCVAGKVVYDGMFVYVKRKECEDVLSGLHSEAAVQSLS